jgi:hypothetical protein
VFLIPFASRPWIVLLVDGLFSRGVAHFPGHTQDGNRALRPRARVSESAARQMEVTPGSSLRVVGGHQSREDAVQAFLKPVVRGNF